MDSLCEDGILRHLRCVLRNYELPEFCSIAIVVPEVLFVADIQSLLTSSELCAYPSSVTIPLSHQGAVCQ